MDGRRRAVRFGRPRVRPVSQASPPACVDAFRGEVIHAFSYPGAQPFHDRATLVYGNGISGLEIASDLAPHAPVVSAFRKPRYVIQKVVDGVSSDWQWYTLFGAIERRHLPPDEWGRRQRERIERVAGNPADFGAPEPSRDVRVAGLSLCQDYLAQVRDGSVVCRPGIASIEGRTVTFTDGSTETVDAIICATGYDVDIPYLSEDVSRMLGETLRSTSAPSTRTCGGSGSSASSSRRGRTSRCLNSKRAGSRPSGAARWSFQMRPSCGALSRNRGRRSTHTTRSRLRFPRSSGSPLNRSTGRTCASRCCSGPCCRRATGSPGPAHCRMRASPSHSSSRPASRAHRAQST